MERRDVQAENQFLQRHYCIGALGRRASQWVADRRTSTVVVKNNDISPTPEVQCV
ncbi:unnamed protein product [Phyllotreta striolata]|uniref:Uncharacterized protein n=1 Tax=Phyllotreta striolata TaxID=444603 RepID=A0A9N9TYU6_PHYSR|nr:unnamed protein product [Phyllotreta striolata]